VSLDGVRILVNNFPELKGIGNGKTITFMISTVDGKTKIYYIGKTNTGMTVMEANLDTDIAISMDEGAFVQLANSNNKCTTLKQLTETSVSAVPLVDQTQLSGFCGMKNCISQAAVPALSYCIG
jgi:hypothetical protein